MYITLHHFTSSFLYTRLDTSIKCPILPNLENGFIIGLCQPIAGFTCRFGCMNGYSISNPSQLTCLNTGHWSSAPPVCENYLTNDCDLNSLKASFKNGFINCNQNERSQFECRFSCFAGYVLTGTPTINCQANGKFNSIPPTCVSIENPNGLVEYHSPITSPNFGYSKPFNYLAGSSSVQCSQTARLKSGSTICDCQGSIQVGCICRFFCNDDHYLIGSPMIACTKHGNWSSSTPTCRRKLPLIN